MHNFCTKAAYFFKVSMGFNVILLGLSAILGVFVQPVFLLVAMWLGPVLFHIFIIWLFFKFLTYCSSPGELT